MTSTVIDPFWSNDISILFRTDRILEFFVSDDQSISEKLNSIARFGIYISIILSLYHKEYKYLTLSILTFSITYFIYKNKNIEKFEEEINNDDDKDIFTQPTVNNPFGNSSVMDIIDNPTKPPMVDYSTNTEKSLKIKEDIETKFNYNLYKDVGDLYGRQNSQRQYYTTPSRGNIPPDPKGEFKQWLYGSMTSCKDNTYNCGINEDLRASRQVLVNSMENPEKIK